jgi:hypothetical protein
VFLYFAAPRKARLELRSLRIRRRDGSRAKPSFLAVSGGMKDARRRAASAISEHVAESPTPTVDIRIEELVGPEGGEDFVEWQVKQFFKGLAAGIELAGKAPVPLK